VVKVRDNGLCEARSDLYPHTAMSWLAQPRVPCRDCDMDLELLHGVYFGVQWVIEEEPL
jgi:hypothetical protein